MFQLFCILSSLFACLTLCSSRQVVNSNRNEIAIEAYLQYLHKQVFYQVNGPSNPYTKLLLLANNDNNSDNNANPSPYDSATQQQLSELLASIGSIPGQFQTQKPKLNPPTVQLKSFAEASEKIDQMYRAMSGLIEHLITYKLGLHFVAHCKDQITGLIDVRKCTVNSWIYKMFVAEFNSLNLDALNGDEQRKIGTKIERAVSSLKTRHLYRLIFQTFPQ